MKSEKKRKITGLIKLKKKKEKINKEYWEGIML